MWGVEEWVAVSPKLWILSLVLLSSALGVCVCTYIMLRASPQRETGHALTAREPSLGQLCAVKGLIRWHSRRAVKFASILVLICLIDAFMRVLTREDRMRSLWMKVTAGQSLPPPPRPQHLPLLHFMPVSLPPCLHLLSIHLRIPFTSSSPVRRLGGPLSQQAPCYPASDSLGLAQQLDAYWSMLALWRYAYTPQAPRCPGLLVERQHGLAMLTLHFSFFGEWGNPGVSWLLALLHFNLRSLIHFFQSGNPKNDYLLECIDIDHMFGVERSKAKVGCNSTFITPIPYPPLHVFKKKQERNREKDIHRWPTKPS